MKQRHQSGCLHQLWTEESKSDWCEIDGKKKKKHFLNVLLQRVGRMRGTTDTVQSLPLTHFSDTFLRSTLEPLEAASCFVGILKLGLWRKAVDQNWLSCWVAPVTVVPAWTTGAFIQTAAKLCHEARGDVSNIMTKDKNQHWHQGNEHTLNKCFSEQVSVFFSCGALFKSCFL